MTTEWYIVDLYGTFSVPRCASLWEASNLLRNLKDRWNARLDWGMYPSRHAAFVAARQDINIRMSTVLCPNGVKRTANQFSWTGIEVMASSEEDAIRKVKAAISAFMAWHPCGKPTIRYT